MSRPSLRPVLLFILSTALVLSPGSTHAQRARSGSAAPGAGGGAGGGAMRMPSTKDIEKMNPAALLVEKKKKLGLDDEQAEKLSALRDAIAERNAPLVAEYDTVRRAFHPPQQSDMGATGRGMSATMSDTEMAKLRTQMQTMMMVGARLHERHGADVKDALAILREEQLVEGRKIIAEQEEKFEQMFPGRRRS